MVSENDPGIEVTWFDDPDWINITEYVKEFKARNAGVLKVSQATVTLQNKEGRFTSGSEEIPPMSLVNIRGDVRGVWDNIFLGRFYNFKGDYSRTKHHLKIICRGHGQQFLMDTKTRNYGEEDITGLQSWTLKQVIENFLVYTDSGYSTGFSLETDNGDITTKHAGEECNLEHNYLLDCLRKIAERINYDGYVKLVDSTPTLLFKSVGSETAFPAVTLEHPFIYVYPEFNIDDIYNYILVKGGIEKGVPPFGDEWSENVMAKYDPDIWLPETENDVLADSDRYNIGAKVNNRCLEVTTTVPGPGAYLDVTKTEEEPYIDCTGLPYEKRFKSLNVWIGMWATTTSWFIQLEDNATPTPNKIEYKEPQHLGMLVRPDWQFIDLGVGENLPINSDPYLGWLRGQWYYVDSSTFNWKITKIHVKADGGLWLYIDGLQFLGGRLIDPLLYPTWNPPVKDQASIDAYGRRVLWYEDERIISRVIAQLVGETILGIRKYPHRRIVCKKGAKIWVKPHQVVTLNVPQYKIYNEEWRPIEIETTFKSPKPLRTAFTLVPKTFGVSSKAYLEDELVGLIGR